MAVEVRLRLNVQVCIFFTWLESSLLIALALALFLAFALAGHCCCELILSRWRNCNVL